MTKRFLLVTLLIPFLGCSQNKTGKDRIIVDYQGKELTDEQIQDFFKEEQKHFESLKQTENVSVTKTDNIRKDFPELIASRKNEIDGYNFDKRLIQQYSSNMISSKEFVAILDALDPKIKKHIPPHFARVYIPRMKEDRALLKKVLALDSVYNKSEYSFLIRCTQQVDGFRKELEDSLRSDAFYKKEYPHAGDLLTRYAVIGNNKATLELLEIAVAKTRPDEQIDNAYQEYFLSAFEYLMLNGDEAIKNGTRSVIFQYLAKTSFYAMYDEGSLFPHEISDDLKKLIKTRLANIDTIADADDKEHARKKFNEYYLSHYARNYGVAALPRITTLIDQKGNKYDRARAIDVLKELTKYNKLTDKEKQTVLDLLKKAGIQEADGYDLPRYISIIKNMYPQKQFSDVSALFKDAEEAQMYWNERRYSVDSLEYYLAYISKIGLLKKQPTPKEIYLFKKQYGEYEIPGVVWGLLDLAGVSLNYDCETGMWPNPYDDLLQNYLDLCSADLKGYYPLFKYEKLNDSKDDYTTRYTIAITNGSTGYVSHPEDASDWYDPVTVEATFNTALKDQGIDKRFLQIITGDQTVLTVYCLPGQLKLFADKFGMELTESRGE